MRNSDSKITDIKACRKVLIPRFDTFGDIVLLEGLLQALIDFLPEARITLLVRDGYDQLSDLFPKSLQWKTTRINPFRELEQLADLSLLLDDLQKERYDLVLFTAYTRTWLDDLVAAALSSSQRVAFSREQKGNSYLLRMLAEINIPCPDSLHDAYVRVEEKSHETEKYQALWESLTGSANSIFRPLLTVPDEAASQARMILGQAGLSLRKFVFCFPAGVSNVPSKNWSPAKFADVIAYLENQCSLKVLVAGHETEKSILDEVIDLSEKQNASPKVWLGKDGDLALACAIAAESAFYFGNDTGLMHMAAALNKPVVAIFGGGSWPRFLPVTDSGRVFFMPLSCFYCLWNCYFDEALCLKYLDSTRVTAEIERFLIRSNQGNDALEMIEMSLAPEYGMLFFEKSVESILTEKKKLQISEADREARLAAIRDMSRHLEKEREAYLADRNAYLADREAHQTIIQNMTRHLEEERQVYLADREAHQTIIQNMSRHLEAEHEAYLADREGHQVVIRDLTNRLHASAEESAMQKSELLKISTSLSWRLTSPLRRIAAFFLKN